MLITLTELQQLFLQIESSASCTISLLNSIGLIVAAVLFEYPSP